MASKTFRLSHVLITFVVVLSFATRFRNTHAHVLAGDADDEVVRVETPDVSTRSKTAAARRRRSPIGSSEVVKTERKIAWENEPVTIPCENPQYFVTWKFTQNKSIQYANGPQYRSIERKIGPTFLASPSINDKDVNITKNGSLQIFHLKIEQHDGTFECDTALREVKVKVLLEVRREPNATYIEGYNGTLLDPNKIDPDGSGAIASTDEPDQEIILPLWCVTESAKPPVNHLWFKVLADDDRVPLSPVTSETIQVNDVTGVKTTKSQVNLRLSPKDQGAVVECRAEGPAIRSRTQRAVTKPFAIVVPATYANTISAHIVGAVIGLIVLLMLISLFIYMRKNHGAKSENQTEKCQADIRPMLLDIEEKKTPEHHAINAVRPSEVNQNHFIGSNVVTVGDGIIAPPPRCSVRVDLLYPGSSTTSSSSPSPPAFPPTDTNGAVISGQSVVEVDAQQPLLSNSTPVSPPSSAMRCPPPPPVHGGAVAHEGKPTNAVPPKPRARQSKMGVSSLDASNSNKSPHVQVVMQDHAVAPKTNPIRITDLAEYVKSKQLHLDYFENEYNMLPKGQLHPWEAAKKPEHRTKNRFRDMIPYDHSRVKLDMEDQEDPSATDYINASWINGYDRPREWIATQGPNKFTINDFWRMCWQVGAVRIVMVTNLVENGKPKCNLYWPEDSCLYGSIHVKMVSSDKLADYTVRTFLVTNAKNHQSREIKQFHFTSWPDHGTPTFPTALLAYYRRVMEFTPPNDGAHTTVVHCSAGVGRTGTFISLDILLKQAFQTGYVDMLGVVNSLREQRINMVQTKEQYVFLHSAVNDALLCGETFIPVVDFTKYHQQLCEETISSGKTKILEQFETLNEVSPVHSESEFHDGKEPANRSKNRYQDILPSDRYRPYLLTTTADGVNNYINAVFVTGYQNKHGFIATQMPLPNTINDFWCLVWDHHVSSIVMLNDVSLSLSEPSLSQETNNNGIYWPTIKGHPMPFHQFEVELLAEETNGNLTTRTFRLGLPDDQVAPSLRQSHRMIRQFQVNGWPETQALPSSPVVFVDLLHHVERWQLQAGGGPILSHCLNGQTRTGLYCAASFVVDKIKTEQGVDVFHAVRSIRLSRGGFVENLDQYNFCYEIAQTFLDTFETYSNFDLKSGGAYANMLMDDKDDIESSPPSSPSVDTVVPPRAETFI